MKSKIFGKLKQEYAALGLGDEVLMSRAEALADMGLVTDDNIDAVVATQRKDLEGLQKRTDKRVTEALEKERKKREEETKKKEAEEAAAKAAKEAEEAEAKKKAEEEKAKKEAEAKKKAEDEAERKRLEDAAAKAKKPEEEPVPNPINELIELIKENQNKAQQQRDAYEAQLQALAERFEQQQKESSKSVEDLMTQYNDLRTNYTALHDENERARAAKAKADRESFILNKAKELGVPQWRIEEGFAFKDDADETAIADMLAKTANNIKSGMLPTNKSGFPLSDNKPTAEEIADLAKSIVK